MTLKSGIFNVILLSALALSGCIVVSNDSKPAAAPAAKANSSFNRSHYFVAHCVDQLRKNNGYDYENAVTMCSCIVNNTLKKYGSEGTKELLEGPLSKKEEQTQLRPVVEACYNRHIDS